MKIFLLGATGNAGRRILRMALDRGHSVTALVRRLDHLSQSTAYPERLRVVPGHIERLDELAPALPGHDVVINAAGHISQGDRFSALVRTVVEETQRELGAGTRFWQFGGAALLGVPGTELMGVDLPLVPKLYEAHRTNFNRLSESSLDWSMLCPGPMLAARDGQPTKGLRLYADKWPDERAGINHLVPKAALSLIFRDKIPELTISYEDAASVILDNLAPRGQFEHRRVCVALPLGMSNITNQAD